MKIAICDDNLQDTAQIHALIQDHFDKNGFTGEIHTFSSGESLLEAFAACPFDVVFLDIYLNGIDGMKTAELLRKMDSGFALIFITISQEHALQSYSYRPSYYLCKPVKCPDIENAFQQCRHLFLKNARFIEVKSGRVQFKIPLIKIRYVETFGRETLFHTSDGDIKTTAHLRFDDLEQKLCSAFLRCHRSYIVNMNHVEAIQTDNFQMCNGIRVPLRQRRRQTLRNAFADFVSNRLFEVSS